MSNLNLYKNEFVRLLRRHRTRNRLTKTQLAEKLGVSATTTIKYETVDSPNLPDGPKLEKLLQILNLSDDEQIEFLDAIVKAKSNIPRLFWELEKQEGLQERIAQLREQYLAKSNTSIKDFGINPQVVEIYKTLEKLNPEKRKQLMRTFSEIAKLAKEGDK